MNLNTMFPSTWLKKEDVQQPLTAVIQSVVMDEINSDHGKEEKPILRFAGNVKPLILNRGNAETIASFYGDDSAAWTGKSIELYFDPSVMFGGKRVGGIRVRKPATAGVSMVSRPATVNTSSETHWDVSDGSSVLQNQTAAQVEQFLYESNADPKTIRVKPAGSDRSQAKTADQYGFGIQPPVGDADPIPF
jgi:hypothetical protein